MRVLVIEDDEEMAEAIAFGLRQTGMAVDVALDGQAGFARATVNDYDVIVLDRDLPGMHGDEVCAKLVDSECRSRVLMLTAAAMVEDLVDGLGLGADDYLPKPFDFPVLVARIGALTRRAQPAIPPLLRHEDLVLDTAQHRAFSSRPGDRARAEGVRRARAAARLAGSQRLRRGAPRARVGRGRGPVHERGQDHDQPPALKARRSPDHRDGRQVRLPDLSAAVRFGRQRTLPARRAAPAAAHDPPASGAAVRRRVLHLRRRAAGAHLRRRLAHSWRLYAGRPRTVPRAQLCRGASAGARRASRACGLPPSDAAHARQAVKVSIVDPNQRSADLRVLAVVSVIALAVMAAVSMGLGWLIAGRVLRPLRTITTRRP